MDPDALQLIKKIKDGITATNQQLDLYIPAILIVWLLWSLISYTVKKIEKEGIGKGIYFGSLAFFETSLVILLLFTVQWIAVFILGKWLDASLIRWGLIYAALVPYWYFSTHKNSGRRGVYSLIFILTAFSIGWYYDRWVGILFVTTPILGLFFHIAGSFSQTVLPVNDPENKDERWQKTLVFLKYLLGIQYPMWVTKTKTERNLDLRIKGNNILGFGKPGVIHTWSHQVVGLSKGIEFNRVEGPGIIFTQPFENPIALVDLRTQLRVSHIETVTKDGMKVTAVVFAAFSINRQKLPKRMYAELRHTIGRDFEINHPDGSYSYSSGRIYSLLSMSRLNATPANDAQKPDFYWDEWVVKQVEHAAREVVSDRTLDELWRPRVNEIRRSALDEMADALKSLVMSKMIEAGVNLYTVRIVNYDIKKESLIRQQNIETWSSRWEQKIREAEASVEMIRREEIENAQAYAKSKLLGVVTDSINEARSINENLPRYVIAQYYVYALEEYLKGQPGSNVEEQIEKAKEILFYKTEGNE